MYVHGCTGFPVIINSIVTIKRCKGCSWPHVSEIIGPTSVKSNLPKSFTTIMDHMEAICQETWSTELTIITNNEADDDNEDSDMLLEAPHSHIELSKNRQVAFVVIHLD